MMKTLPNLVKLGDVAAFIRGITFKPEDLVPSGTRDSVVCMRTKNVQATLDETDILTIPASFVRRQEQFLKTGDILMSTANSWNLVGKSCLVPHLHYPATAGGFISILRAQKDRIDPRYLYYWTTSPETQNELRNCGRQTTNISNLDFRRAEELEVPIPSTLTEQKRLAAILDQADGIRRKRQQALRLTDDFLRSVFLDLFGDPSMNSKSWVMGTIGDLLQSVNYGTSQKAHSERDGVPVLRMNNITYSGGWDFTSLKYTIFEEKDRKKYLVNNGEMLFNRTNSRELVGKTAVFRRDEPMAYAGYLVRAVAKSETDIEYVAAYLNSEHGKKTLLNMCKSIVGMANINAQEMRSIPIPLPPPELQRKFGDIVRAVESRREFHLKATTEAETLFQSLQHRAFTGQL